MKRYISQEFSNLKEATKAWEAVPQNGIRISPYYLFGKYYKGQFKFVQITFTPKNDKELSDVKKIKEFISLEEVKLIESPEIL